ncbi:MAG: DUF4065 domain-containing protein [Bacteroidia bacterium]|nr:DUF4065 domain-containing protein [Bacteroidia bacterium]
MKSPITGKEMRVGKELRDMIYRKEIYSIWFHYYQCEDTEEKFEDEQFSTLNYNQVVNQYRVRYHVPFPEDIKEIRTKYELSAAKISDLLGMGANSWRNYEDGEIPSRANANLIQMISKPEGFEKYIKEYSGLEEKECDKILKPVLKLRTDSCFCNDPLYRFYFQPDITTGFKAFNREKTKNVILYFAERQSPYKTKMNKLLFYSDFVHFRNTAQSITGLKYAAIPLGPVPNHFEYLFEALVEEGIICKETTMTNYGEVEQILPSGEVHFDPSFFTTSELEALDYVANTFKDKSASEIADISHREPAWKDNIEGKKIIPFTYAFGLETV